jgi:hypothetical protein
MSAAQAIKPNSPVWVWNGGWWPAVVIDAFPEGEEGFLVLRYEHGISGPALLADVEPRDPALRGADKPQGSPGGDKPVLNQLEKVRTLTTTATRRLAVKKMPGTCQTATVSRPRN